MIKILTIYEQESTTQLMLCNFLKEYASRTGNAIVCKKSICIDCKALNDCDVILTIRSMCPYEKEIIRFAKSIGKVCIAFWDDDLTENNENLFILETRRSAMLDVLKNSNAILSPNRYLSEKLADIGKIGHAFTIDTAVDISVETQCYGENKNRVRIVYAAGPTHAQDFGDTLFEAFRLLNNRHPGSFDLSFVGVKPTIISKPAFPVYYYPCMSMSSYKHHMMSQGYDIGIAPLKENEFTKAKYYNKYIDYTIHNLVGVYSNCLPYTLIVKDGYNGLLANDDVKSWYEKLESLIVDRNLRENLRNNACDVVKNQFNTSKIVEKFERDIKSIAKNSNIKCEKYKGFFLSFSKIKYILFKMIYLPVVYTKEIGLRKMFARMINHINSVNLIKKEGVIK